MPTERTIERPRDLERIADLFIWERSFAWRQSSLRVLQVQTLGVTAYAVGLLLGAAWLASAALLSTTAWSLLHARLQTLDMRRCREARDTHPVLTGLHAIGGFGGLPAAYAKTLLTEAPNGDAGGDFLLLQGRRWQQAHLAETEIRETFMLLAAEFQGTADELLATSENLLRT